MYRSWLSPIPSLASYRFQRSHLLQAAQMSFGLTELGGEEGLNKVPRHRRSHGPATQAEDVHVIVLHPLAGREMVMDQRGAHAGDLIGTHRCADAAAADCDATLDLPCRHSPGERDDKVRIVVIRVQTDRTEIDNLMSRG